MQDQTTPPDGIAGLKTYWRNDLVAAISVALVALPLSLGIAIASGVPPISGLICAVIGGLVATFFRGSYVGINGPAAGLIAVILASMSTLDDGTGKTFQYILAAIVVTGFLQILLGFFKLGRLADLFPSSVVQGILAAIGVIIFSKQIHVALGTTSNADTPIGVLADAFSMLPEAHPVIAAISLVSLALLTFHSRISYKFFHFFPAPMLVLLVSLFFSFGFNFLTEHSMTVFGQEYLVGPHLLVSIPDNLLDALVFPDFSCVHKGAFWITVISMTLISSVETLASTKAVDKLDPHKRNSNLNRELIGVGIATMVAGALGGLPVVTVIVRSTVNLHNNAQTRWSNFFHGLLLLLFVLALSPLIQRIPLAALASILVFTGFKLAAPRIFKNALALGLEQFLILTGTLLITLYTDLLRGITGGILLTLVIHLLLSRSSFMEFIKLLFRRPEPTSSEDGKTFVALPGIANFLSLPRYRKVFESIPSNADLQIDLTNARLVDHTVLENLDELRRNRSSRGGSVELIGLENHIRSSKHPLALRSLYTDSTHLLTKREQRLKAFAESNNWSFRHEVDWGQSYLTNFKFFKSRPIEKKANVIGGSYENQSLNWEIGDITFDEGALLATEVYNTTVMLLRLTDEIPRFVIEEEGIFDKLFEKVRAFSGSKDIDFDQFPVFSDRFLVKSDREQAVRDFLTPEIITFLESQDVYHIESNGEALLFFRYMRLAKSDEVERMVEFVKEFCLLLTASKH